MVTAPRHERYSAVRRVGALSALWGAAVSALVLVSLSLTSPLTESFTIRPPVLKDLTGRHLPMQSAPKSNNFVMAPATVPRLELPLVASVVRAAQTLELRVRAGDTLIQLLSGVGATLADAHAAARALESVFHPRKIRAGWKLQVTLAPEDSDGELALQSVAFRPSVERDVEVVRSESDGDTRFQARAYARALRVANTWRHGTIDDSLFGAGAAAGVPDRVLAEAIQMLSFNVDFQRDLRAGDAFEFVYDSFFDDRGALAKTGELKFARLVLRGKDYSYYRFTPHSGVTDLFSADGKSIRRSLLRTPVDAARISSNFGMRRHPILGYTKLHRGVDFAVAAGTPIRAAGSGVIEKAGRLGSYGNYVRIRHDATYSTAYAHLKGFAGGIRAKVRVRQGDIIGYVGATGRATGPHLHYEVLKNNRQVSPRGLRLPAGASLSGNDLVNFLAQRIQLDALRSNSPSTDALALVADSVTPPS